MEDKQHVWTFRVFLCRTHIYADAAHPESALDKKAAAGLLGGKGKQIFSVIGTGGRGVYGKVVWMLMASIILGIGHIGIHLQHRRENPA